MNAEQTQHYEADLSAVLDGELDGEPLRRTIDALAEDSQLREFWKQSRKLQASLVTPDEERAGVTPLPELWDNIERETSGNTFVVALKRLPMRSLAAAATLLLVVSLTLSGLLKVDIPLVHSGDQSVQLGAQRGTMTEERFIQLTKELLQADPRYHRKMLEVMELVNEQAYGYETASSRRSSNLAGEAEENGSTPNRQDTSPAQADAPPRGDRGNMELTLW